MPCKALYTECLHSFAVTYEYFANHIRDAFFPFEKNTLRQFCKMYLYYKSFLCRYCILKPDIARFLMNGIQIDQKQNYEYV